MAVILMEDIWLQMFITVNLMRELSVLLELHMFRSVSALKPYSKKARLL
jgi:hypothetical protein